jgi:hypothetical protein
MRQVPRAVTGFAALTGAGSFPERLEMKRCAFCGLDLALITAALRARNCERVKRSVAKHRDRYRQYQREYRAKHRDDLADYQRKYRARQREAAKQ